MTGFKYRVTIFNFSSNTSSIIQGQTAKPRTYYLCIHQIGNLTSQIGNLIPRFDYTGIVGLVLLLAMQVIMLPFSINYRSRALGRRCFSKRKPWRRAIIYPATVPCQQDIMLIIPISFWGGV